MTTTILGVVAPPMPHECGPFPASQPTWQVVQCDCGKAWRLEPLPPSLSGRRYWSRYPAADAGTAPPPRTSTDWEPPLGMSRTRPLFDDAVLGDNTPLWDGDLR